MSYKVQSPLSSVTILLTGTDPKSRRGGIGIALPGYLRAIEFAGFAWRSIPTYHPTASGGKWQLWLSAFPKLRQEIRQLRRRGLRVVVYSHAGARLSLVREFFVLAFCRALGARTILQLHAIEVDTYLRHPLKRLFLKLTLSPAHGIAVLTDWWQSRLDAAGVHKPIFVIPNPMPEEWELLATQSSSARVGTNKVVMLIISRLVPGKGIDLVIDAMPLLPETFELIVAGEGNQLSELERHTQELSLGSRVRFVGWVAGTEKQQLIDVSDIFVLPSRYDSFGLGFIEAMANGLPVVAAHWGPISDVVSDGRCGVLIRDYSARALADAIMQLADPDLRFYMGAEGKNWVSERFSSREVSRRIHKMIESLIDQDQP